MTTTRTIDDYPSFSGARPASCPFDPPAEYTRWRQADGLQRVRLSDGSLAWAISRPTRCAPGSRRWWTASSTR